MNRAVLAAMARLMKFGGSLVAIWLLAIAVPAAAQSPQPTAEQMRMLNQLPPSQREAAMQALREYQSTIQNNNSAGNAASNDNPNVNLTLPPQQDSSRDVSEAERRADANGRLVVNLVPKSGLSARELADIEDDPVLSKLTGSHAFTLDEHGQLSLMDLLTVPLLGLTAADIERRLGAETMLAPFEIDVLVLEAGQSGVEALRPFGYDLFDPREVSFDPSTSGPVPPDYVLGPGDSVRVQLFGNVNNVYEVTVSRDGVINFHELGPVTVAGLTFDDFREDVRKRVQDMLIGTQVSVTMGELRTMRVFVLGDVNQPGSYVVDSFATISSALYRSGGISRVGSLRDIQLKRNGKLISRLDLYDLLIYGDTSGDARLQQGDAIFVPAVGPQISVAGAVKRPAIYEMRDGGTVADTLALAGGTLADAYAAGIRIERVTEARGRTVLSVNNDGRNATSTAVQAGDVIIVPRVLPDYGEAVSLVGHVHRPGSYPWSPGMRLTDLLPSVYELKPAADLGYLLVRREDPQNREVSVLSANLSEAIANPGSAADIRLDARDTVHVFSLAYGRQRFIEPILNELEAQSNREEPLESVEIAGKVVAPGDYPLEPGMRISDLVRAGGNLSEQAYTLNAELTRYTVVNGEYRASEVLSVDLAAVLQGDLQADLPLSAHDHLRINPIPLWDNEWTVTLRGEVNFPGEFRIRRGETLQEVIARANGLTDDAFPEGAIFLRESLRKQEQDQIGNLIQRLETDLAALSLQSVETSGRETLSTGTALLDQLRDTEAVGRLVIDLNKVVADADVGGDQYAVELQDGDELLVPTKSQVVTVIGEVQQGTSHLYRAGLDREDYLALSGGLTRRADKKLIYVVRANGAVVAGKRSLWFRRGSGVEMRPGDTIVVPLETDRIRPLTFWGSVTQILYQGAIAVSAIRSFEN